MTRSVGSVSCVFFYRELSEVFTFMRVLPGRLASPAQLIVEPHEQVPDGLGAGNDVEWRWKRAALVKVTHPEFGTSKLPLNVSMVLWDIGSLLILNGRHQK